MKSVVKQGGFTLVETLIVLAIMATLFVIAIGELNTTQHNLSFHTAVNDLQQQLQSVINDTSNGNYKQSNTICSQGAIPQSTPVLNAGPSSAQGTNFGCTFIGTILAFGSSTGLTPSMADLTTFRVYPVATGNIESGGGSISGYHLVALAPTSASSPIPSLVNTYGITNGLNLVGYSGYGGSSLTNAPVLIGIAYYSGPAVGTGLTSQATDEALYQVRPSYSPSVGSSYYDSQLIYSSLLALDTSSENLCFASGTTANQSVKITLGNNSNNGISVSSTIYGDGTCS